MDLARVYQLGQYLIRAFFKWSSKTVVVVVVLLPSGGTNRITWKDHLVRDCYQRPCQRKPRSHTKFPLTHNSSKSWQEHIHRKIWDHATSWPEGTFCWRVSLEPTLWWCGGGGRKFQDFGWALRSKMHLLPKNWNAAKQQHSPWVVDSGIVVKIWLLKDTWFFPFMLVRMTVVHHITKAEN